MPNFNSATYLKLYVNKYLATQQDRGGPVFCLPFTHTITTEVAADTVNLCVIPAGAMVLDWAFANDAMGASTTMALGDAGSSTRYYPATSVTAAGKAAGNLTAGQLYIPTADTIVLATFARATPTAAAVLKGYFLVILAA